MFIHRYRAPLGLTAALPRPPSRQHLLHDAVGAGGSHLLLDSAVGAGSGHLLLDGAVCAGGGGAHDGAVSSWGGHFERLVVVENGICE